MDGSAFSVKLLLYDLTKGVGNGSSTAARYNYQESVVCRSPPPRQQLSVSLMEKFLGFGGENSQTSKLAATSSKVFAKTDTEIVHARGREVPESDSHLSNRTSPCRARYSVNARY